jgi:hypothetical protein
VSTSRMTPGSGMGTQHTAPACSSMSRRAPGEPAHLGEVARGGARARRGSGAYRGGRA